MICPICSATNPDVSMICSSCGGTLTVTQPTHAFALATGTRLKGGDYTIGKVLGQGGFGITYLGTEVQLHRLVAIKELFPSGCFRQSRTVQPGNLNVVDLEGLKRRFLEEAHALAKFNHSSIAHVYTFFEENNTGYMVMEFIRGRPLTAVVMDHGPIAEAEALKWIEQAGDALRVVHQANIIHRDLNPNNIMLSEESRIVLIDFGLAREFAVDKSRSMTKFATPGYAPLEQYGSKARFGPPTDIYALGGTLYYLLTSVPPIPSLDRANGVMLDPPKKLNDKVSTSTNEVILWAMEMLPDQRPQGLPEFLKALSGQSMPSRKSPGPKTAPGAVVFKFKNGEAAAVADLVLLCDRYEDEAEDYLFNGYFEKWLVQIGEAALAQEARKLTISHSRDKRKGLEMFVREACKAAGLNPWPMLVAQPTQLDLGQLPVGARITAQVRLKNQGRGYAWGSVGLQPSLSGVTLPAQFDGSYAQISLQIDLGNVAPGTYQSKLVVQGEGVPSALHVGVQLNVVPISLRFDPAVLQLGVLAFGKTVQTNVRLETGPAGGWVRGTVNLDPPLPGVVFDTKVDGSISDVHVSIETAALEAGETYKANLGFDTNAGKFQVPIRFKTSMDWSTVWRWSLGCAVGGAGVLGSVRALIASTAPSLGAWFLTFKSDSETMPIGGIVGAFVIGAAVFKLRQLRKKEVTTQHNQDSSGMS